MGGGGIPTTWRFASVALATPQRECGGAAKPGSSCSQLLARIHGLGGYL